jgi:tyrosyl-tRNA synthetase
MPTTELSAEDFVDGKIGVLYMMVKAGLAASNGEARRLVQQGGVSINDEKITDASYALSVADFDNEIILKKGKKIFNKYIVK